MAQNNYYDSLLTKKPEQDETLAGTTTSDVTKEPGIANDPDASLKAELGKRQKADVTGTDEGQAQTQATQNQGFEYSWDQKGTEKAKTQLGADILSAETESTTNRSSIDQSAREYQTQMDMAPYVDAQNAEKVGWAGGYVLDQKRQTEYLKASIQAQLYGAMELQKYGYDSALAAARLSYDLNMQNYAQEYYKDAVQTALSEAQLTGTYISAEYRDMISQYQTAKGISGDQTASPEDKQRADGVISSIKNWLSANGVTEAAFDAMATVMSETQKTLDQRQLEWQMYQAALQATESKMEEDVGTRFQFNDDGTVKVDQSTGQAMTINLDKASRADIEDYIQTKQGEDSYYSYVKQKMVGEIQSGFQVWAKSSGKIVYDSEGNVTNIKGDVNDLFNTYLKESGVLEKYGDMLTFDGKNYKTDWNFHITLPGNTTYDVNYDTLSKYEAIANNTQKASTDKTSPQFILTNWKTYEWLNNGTPLSNTVNQLRDLKVGRADGKTAEGDRWEMSKVVGDEINKMESLVKNGTYASGTLFWLERNGESHDTYLVLYYDDGYYLVSNDDRERASSNGTSGEGTTYARYADYEGPKVRIMGSHVISSANTGRDRE